MKINENTVIAGRKTLLVPYEAEHVPRYHEWMSDPELQELTASEPLSLEQEYEMQKSWRIDENKCTFIILDAEKYKETESEKDSMVGDVNLFFNDSDDPHSAEIEIMIAESNCRGKGLGKEALLSMMSYGVQKLNIQTFTAKIGMKNTASQNLFQRVGFKELSRCDVFEEVTLELAISDQAKSSLLRDTGNIQISERR